MMLPSTLALGLALGAGLTFAGPAHAVVVDTDRPKLTGTGYDFGGSTLVAGSPTSGGRLTFDLSAGKVHPRLTGTLHLNDADGTCARMRLEYRDKHDNALTDPRYGGTVCAEDDRHRRFSVDLDPFADHEIHNVRVSVMRKTATDWSTVDAGRYAVDGHSDDVKITEDGVDFGCIASPGILGGLPCPGTMNWHLDGAEVEPRLFGFLHLRNLAGTCARMNLRYLSASGSFLTARSGGEVCASDNGYHWAVIDLGPYASSKIAKVKIQLQTQGSNGAWNVAGAQTVSIAE